MLVVVLVKEVVQDYLKKLVVVVEVVEVDVVKVVSYEQSP